MHQVCPNLATLMLFFVARCCIATRQTAPTTLVLIIKQQEINLKNVMVETHLDRAGTTTRRTFAKQRNNK
jgi:hypothetical protein